MTFPALPITWTLDGFSFNVGVDSFGHSTIVDVPEWDSAPSPKPRITEKTDAHGAFAGPNYRQGRTYTIKGTAQAQSTVSREQLRDRLAELCMDEHTLYPLVCTNPHRGDALTAWVLMYDDPEIRRLPDGISLSIDLPLFAPDPWKYSEPNDAADTGLATAGTEGILWNGSPSASGGIEWNGSPTVSGGLIYDQGGGSPGILRLFNSGNRPAPIIFQITPEVTNPLLTCLQTQQRIRWLGSVSGGSTLTIDTKTGRVTIGSTSEDQISVGGSLVESEFFTVPPRDRVTGEPGFIDVEYRADSGDISTRVFATNSNVST